MQNLHIKILLSARPFWEAFRVLEEAKNVSEEKDFVDTEGVPSLRSAIEEKTKSEDLLVVFSGNVPAHLAFQMISLLASISENMVGLPLLITGMTDDAPSDYYKALNKTNEEILDSFAVRLSEEAAKLDATKGINSLSDMPLEDIQASLGEAIGNLRTIAPDAVPEGIKKISGMLDSEEGAKLVIALACRIGLERHMC